MNKNSFYVFMVMAAVLLGCVNLVTPAPIPKSGLESNFQRALSMCMDWTLANGVPPASRAGETPDDIKIETGNSVLFDGYKFYPNSFNKHCDIQVPSNMPKERAQQFLDALAGEYGHFERQVFYDRVEQYTKGADGKYLIDAEVLLFVEFNFDPSEPIEGHGNKMPFPNVTISNWNLVPYE